MTEVKKLSDGAVVECCGGTRLQLKGKLFGKLTVLKYTKTKNNKAYWLCKCKCGNTVEIPSGSLTSGNSTTCGCSRVKPYPSETKKTRTYIIWRAMINRCKPSSLKRHFYYDRNIAVCKRWLNYWNFLEDMGDAPKKLELDRINGNKGYSKENCRWATRSQQLQNARVRSNNKSGYKGVFRNEDGKKWVARIKHKHLGTFETKEQAALAYNEAALKEFRDFSFLNDVLLDKPIWFGLKYKHKNIHYNNKNKHWVLKIKKKCLGYFKTQQEAVCMKIISEETRKEGEG